MPRVLIIFPGALGDLICLSPTIAAIARRHPNADLELMARGELAEFAVDRLGISRGHSIDRREVALLFRDSSDDDKTARTFFGAFERTYCFFSVDDPNFRRALTAAAALGLVTFHRFRPEGDGHVAAGYLKDATGESGLAPITLNLSPHDLEDASRALSGMADPRKMIAILPGSGSPTKNWPLEKFFALADRLKRDFPTVFILGPAEESIEAAARQARHQTVANHPLGTVAAIARTAMAFVGNDSGVSHLAAATGTPGVVLFGPTDPARWRPLGRITVLHRMPIDSIEVSEVVMAVHALADR